MKLMLVKPIMNFRIVQLETMGTGSQTIPVLLHPVSGRIVGLPIISESVPAPYSPVGGVQALEELISSDGGFVPGSYLYVFPAECIYDDVYRLKEFSISPIKNLVCSCCGEYIRGRQWHNRDTGYGLGSCCVDYCRRNTSEAEFVQTYGVDGFHFNVTDTAQLAR